MECISWQGEHHFLAMTHKYTTGAPCFIETGHLEPAPVSEKTRERVQQVVFHALNSLEIRNGASHSELKINKDGEIALIEIGGRMGGDMIGSDLVQLSTGIDFVKNVIRVALGEKPDLDRHAHSAAAVRFVFTPKDVEVLKQIKQEHPEVLVREDVKETFDHQVTDSSSRFGYYLMQSSDMELLQQYMPENK